MPQLIVRELAFDTATLAAWKARRRNALPFRPELDRFRRLLKRKVRARTGRTHRFFGEAFVGHRMNVRDIFYSSHKWLTNSKFASERGLANRDQKRLREALHDYFGPETIKELQSAVAKLAQAHKRWLDGKSPTAPDLWVVDSRGRHRFIEVKLPGDKVAPHQLAGLAAIKSVLGKKRPVSVEICQLTFERRLFKDFCRTLRTK